MVFISVPEERFVTDVMKTWLTFLKDVPEFANVNILPRQPDVDVDFKYPAICMLRVEPEDWQVTRNWWFHWRQPFDDDPVTNPTFRIWKLLGYTYMTTYQFDIYSESIWQQNEIVSVLNRYLKNADWTDVFLTRWCATQTVLTLKDFPNPTSATGTDTDLRIRFRYWRDVENIDKSTFDKEIHQYSVTVTFWVDYLKEYVFPSIQDIDTQIETHI